MTGINWIKESGFMEGPILLTGTHSVGTVRDAAIQWQLKNGREFIFTYPDRRRDVRLPERRERRAREADARAFRRSMRAKPGPVQEGAVGGGTGMGCNGFKGGIGTASRRAVRRTGGYTLGVLVQCNYGGDLRILGVPIGQEITDLRHVQRAREPLARPWTRGMPVPGRRRRPARMKARATHEGRGSIIVVVATDAPLLPHQLERLRPRVGMGLGRLGSWAGNSSGDLFLAFSTANPGAARAAGTPALKMLPNDRMDPLFRATIDATEEAVVNAMLAAADDDRRQRHARVRAAGRPGRRGAEEVQPDEVGGEC